MLRIKQAICTNQNFKYVRMAQQVIGLVVDAAVLVLGPCLIVTVFSLVTGELYAFFTVLLPYWAPEVGTMWLVNAAFAIFLAVNIVFNYSMCVLTNPGTHDSAIYKQLLDEAQAFGQLDDRRAKDSRGSGHGASSGPVLRRPVGAAAGEVAAETEDVPIAGDNGGSWVDQGDFEWGYCRRTKMRKAPRAHYDHITKKLVLNMDHYWSVCNKYCAGVSRLPWLNM